MAVLPKFCIIYCHQYCQELCCSYTCYFCDHRWSLGSWMDLLASCTGQVTRVYWLQNYLLFSLSWTVYRFIPITELKELLQWKQCNCGSLQYELQKNAGMNANEAAQCKICGVSGPWNSSVWATCDISAVDCKHPVGKEEGREKKEKKHTRKGSLEVWINSHKFDSVFNDQDIWSQILSSSAPNAAHPQHRKCLVPKTLYLSSNLTVHTA